MARGIELRRVQENASSQASAYERRIHALEATVKRCSSENSTQVRELEATMRVLKGKSDLHAQVLEARSALQVRRKETDQHLFSSVVIPSAYIAYET